MRRVVFCILSALLLAPLPAAAQYGTGPGGRAPYERRDQERNVPGRFDYYALVLSWSPTYCAGLPRNSYDPQCHRRDGRRYAFVLHGLWPQHERGWPENCRTRQRPYVPQPLIDSMLDIMPSSRLVIHEYRKHGTCSGLTPEGYYGLARRLYNSVAIPPRFVMPNNDFTISPDAVVSAFVDANPVLKRDMMAVSCGGPGNRLREVRICFSRSGTPTRCGRNEDQSRLCRASSMYVPPVRGKSAPTGNGRRI
jgi:ribonuclease T2